MYWHLATDKVVLYRITSKIHLKIDGLLSSATFVLSTGQDTQKQSIHTAGQGQTILFFVFIWWQR